MSPARRPRGPKAPPPKGTLRIVAGELRGRRFDAPAGDATRPTADRVRQATFNALESLDVLDGARVLDAFAGSGALGLEALSRGAAQVTFVEADAAARRVLTANVAALGVGERAVVQGGDGTRTVDAGPWDLVLLDPPYAFDGWTDLLERVAAQLSPEGAVVIESDREVPVPGALDARRAKAYGGTVVTIASPRRSTS